MAEFKRMTPAQIFKLGKLLDEHLIIHGPKLCEYKGGENDRTLAEMIEYPNHSAVAGFRVKVFGKLKRPEEPELFPKADLVTRKEFNILCQAFDELRMELGSKIDVLARLITS